MAFQDGMPLHQGPLPDLEEALRALIRDEIADPPPGEAMALLIEEVRNLSVELDGLRRDYEIEIADLHSAIDRMGD